MAPLFNFATQCVFFPELTFLKSVIASTVASVKDRVERFFPRGDFHFHLWIRSIGLGTRPRAKNCAVVQAKV